MLALHSYKIQVDKKEIFKKGTIALLTTFLAGLLFGKQNMMIAFVIVLGSNILTQQNFRIRLWEKTFQLILFDWFIVCISYIASLNKWWAIPINLIMVFSIIYLAMTPFNTLRYKTFMMLYVFCQYSAISFLELPKRLMMVVFAVCIVVGTHFIRQRKNKSLLPVEISKAFLILEEQLDRRKDEKTAKMQYEAVCEEMRSLAYQIYHTSHRRYFTTYLGKVQFQFYLNMSYLNLLILELLQLSKEQEVSSEEALEALRQIIKKINGYFRRQMSRKEVIATLTEYLEKHQSGKGKLQEINEVLYALKKNFEELEGLNHKKKYHVYHMWKRTELSKVNKQARAHFNCHNVSFNFALRMSVILTIGLFLAEQLGYYKFIWAIIPIMSITQPYYEDTHTRRNDRILSNVLAAITITVILEVAAFKWVGYAMLILAFYLIFAYKDYYHFSFFVTVISMIISSVETDIQVLLVYRIGYVLIGALIVTIAARVFPYYLKDGIKDMFSHLQEISRAIESEAGAYAKGEGNLDLLREALIQSAVITSKLLLQNKVYNNQNLEEQLSINTEFCIRIGYRLLRGHIEEV